MRIPLPRRRIRPRTAWITLLTLGFAALVVLPEAVTASGLNAVHRPPTVPSKATWAGSPFTCSRASRSEAGLPSVSIETS